jgi:hypothetical protein
MKIWKQIELNRDVVHLLRYIAFVAMILMPAFLRAQQAAPGTCTSVSSFDKAAPVIYGEPFFVPALCLRVTEVKSGMPQVNKEVIIRYTWRWFEYPYPEHLGGVWSDAYDIVWCTTGSDGTVLVPDYHLAPRGWYNGRLSRGRRPSFKELELSVENYHLWLSTKQLAQLRTPKKNTAVVASRPDHFVGKFRVEVFPAGVANPRVHPAGAKSRSAPGG